MVYRKYFSILILLIFSFSNQQTLAEFNSEPELIPREILFNSSTKRDFKKSPDGKKLSYIAPVNGVMNIWVGDISQDNAKPIAGDTSNGVSYYFWAYNNKHIIFTQDMKTNENYHLYTVNIQTGEIKDHTSSERVECNISGMRRNAPDILTGSFNKNFPDQVIFCQSNNPRTQRFDVYKLYLDSGKVELMEKNPGDIHAWMSDANFKIRAATKYKPDGSLDLIVREDETKCWKTLTNWKLEDRLTIDWATHLVSFSKDGKYIYLKDYRNSNTLRLVKMEISTGKIQVIAEDPEYDICEAVVNADTYEIDAVTYIKEHLYYKIINPSKIRNIKKPKLNDYSIIGPKELQIYKLAPMEPVTIRSRDNLKLHGYITFPPEKIRKNLPIVLKVHGGPHIRDCWEYNPEVQWLANRGYIVLQINYRGSSGYGKKFLNAGNIEWGGKMHNDLVDSVEWAIKQGYADPKHVAIYGHSYGGYAALVGAAFTPDLFCCAVDICGPSDLLLGVRKNYSPEIKQDITLGSWRRLNPYTDQELLRSRSPINKADKIKIPIFIAQGSNDSRVRKSQSDVMAEALKKKQCPL
jgi:dipeptidyl aminopeptidase/acylaminoacyl peptidase